MNSMRLLLFDTNNRIFGPYLDARRSWSTTSWTRTLDVTATGEAHFRLPGTTRARPRLHRVLRRGLVPCLCIVWSDARRCVAIGVRSLAPWCLAFLCSHASLATEASSASQPLAWPAGAEPRWQQSAWRRRQATDRARVLVAACVDSTAAWSSTHQQQTRWRRRSTASRCCAH
jgi:hypothetical protein